MKERKKEGEEDRERKVGEGGKEERSEPMLMVCHVTASMAQTLQCFSPIILTKTIQDRSFQYPHFTDKDAETQRA